MIDTCIGKNIMKQLQVLNLTQGQLQIRRKNLYMILAQDLKNFGEILEICQLRKVKTFLVI